MICQLSHVQVFIGTLAEITSFPRHYNEPTLVRCLHQEANPMMMGPNLNQDVGFDWPPGHSNQSSGNGSHSFVLVA